MPTVTFLGPEFWRNSPDQGAEFNRAVPQEKSQAWIDLWRLRLPASHWRIEGDEPLTVDAGQDGLPDDGWRRGDIIEWIRNNGGSVGRVYQTKTQLLSQVDNLLNPTAPEPIVEETVEEPVVEEVVEEVVEQEEEAATETQSEIMEE